MYTVEEVIKIWNDQTSDRLEIGPDPDSGELVEIKSILGDLGSIETSLLISKEQALLLAGAIQKLYGKGD